MASTSRGRAPARMFRPFALILAFLFFASIAHAASAVLGVDIGTEYIKAALVKPGIPLEIVLTKDSRRKETSAVAFKPIPNAKPGTFPERLYGSDAMAVAARFPGDVYPNLKPLLGLPADNIVVKNYSSYHPALNLVPEKTKGTAAFKSGAFSADEEPWMVEEILAMELQSIQKNAEALAGKGSSVKDVVISIPVFYTAEEKRAVELAAELAGLRILSLVSDGLTVGLNYATSRTFPSITEGGKPETHMVLDMGAGSTKATIMRFQGRTVKDIGKFNKTIQEVEVLGSGWDRTLGGDALNAIIVEDMVQQFVESKAAKGVAATAEAVKGHGRASAKLWKEAERLRQVLSANTNTQASFEGLYEDVDFRYKLSRADFEKMAESYAERVSETVKKALNAADYMKMGEIDSIILHGGATRTPFVQKAVEKVAGGPDKIRSNVNADEAAVFGAGFKGAELSPGFRVKEIKGLEGAAYAAGMKWTNIHKKPQHQRLFQPTSHTGVEKTVSFKNQDDFTISFYQHVPSSEQVSPGSAEKDIMSITTQNLTQSVAVLKEKFGCANADILMKVGVRLSPVNGLPDITKVVVDCEVDDEKKGGVVDGVKGLFGFGSKKDGQEPLKAEEVESTETTESADGSSATSSSATSSESPSASASAKDKKSKSAKDEAPKSSKRLEVINIAYTTEAMGYPPLPHTEVKRMKDRLQAFDDSDRSRRLREEALNQLEGFTYKVRDLLDDESFIAASTPAERKALEEKSKDASEWLYGEGSDATREELKARLQELKDIVNPIEKRREEASRRPDQIQLFKDTLDNTRKLIDTVTQQAAKEAELASASAATTASSAPAESATNDSEGLEDENDKSAKTTSSEVAAETPVRPRYTEQDIESITSQYTSAQTWFSDLLAKQEKLAPTDDPVLLVKDLELKARELNQAVMEIMMKGMQQPPKPKKSSSSKAPKKSKTAKSKAAKPTTLNFEDVEADLGDIFSGQERTPEQDEAIRKLREREKKWQQGKGPDVPVEGEKAHDEL